MAQNSRSCAEVPLKTTHSLIPWGSLTNLLTRCSSILCLLWYAGVNNKHDLIWCGRWRRRQSTEIQEMVLVNRREDESVWTARSGW